MYHYKARMYSPMLDRFLQADPIGYNDQINLYAYVANDPVNGRDPSGLQELVSTSEKDLEWLARYKSQLNETMTRGLRDAEMTAFNIFSSISAAFFGTPQYFPAIKESVILRQAAYREIFSTSGRAFSKY